ncbi:MAG: RagB/SusD family nutrient uptake outer membrane protein [Bacteroidales bacterium]|nr:RagB/SusD family nutrient uptake outer membrane protein [Bacteroidales bacterium]
MKKNLYILCAAAALLFTSCGEKFITAVHNSAEPVDEYFINVDRANQSLVAAYNPLNWLDYAWGYTPLMFLSDIMADDIYCGGSDENDQASLSRAHLYKLTETELPSSIWTALYSGVNRSNVLIEHIDLVPDMSDALKNQYRAEAMVLKAYYYEILWKFWGNIPYYDQNLSQPYHAPQLKADEVYENVISILEEVFTMNALPAKATAGNEGRITLDMAYMLYAEMVMYQEDKSRYEKALGYMETIINSGRYSLVADYASMWEVEGEWGPESIWEINFTSVGSVRSWSNMLASGGHVYGTLIGINGAKKDWYSGWGFGPVAVSAWDMFDEGDIRRDASILDWRNEADNYSARWQDTGLFQRKYIGRKDGTAGALGDSDVNQGSNFRIYRYAETLLNAAELSLALGKDGSKYLKEVQQRAKVKTTDCTLDNIIEERHKEFVSEGKRYWDLVRTGKASQVLKANNHAYREYDWTEDLKYWPIQISEMDKDGDLVQNPYPVR